MAKRFHIRTYGCQMNERDSEALGCLLQDHGYIPAKSETDADIILINTCSVREMAETKALGKAGILVREKRKNPDLILGIIGCMAQNYGAEILEKVPHVDLVVGTDRIHLLPELLADVESGCRSQVEVETGTEILGALQGHHKNSFSSFVSVMRGCNQFCTYCIVPYVRGREKSRSINDVCDEVETVVAQGTKEIFLLGQNITAYGVSEARKAGTFRLENDCPFADLLRAVAAIPGVQRIRFTSPHPRFMNDKFIDAVAETPEVCESFHVPLQSGSDRILKAMHRGYDSTRFRAIVEQLKHRVPGCSLSTDVIVGFPGESDDDFAATRQLMNDVGFDMAYIFKYSPRRGTKSAFYVDDVPTSVKEERNQRLLTDLENRALDRNQRFVGTDVEVMVDGISRRNADRWSGRSRENKVCLFEPATGISPGDLIMCRVERVTASSLMGHLVLT